MNKDVEKDYAQLKEFWNAALAMSEEDKAQLLQQIDPDADWKDVAPAAKQRDALAAMGTCRRVLDYGCGTGWGSIILAKSGVEEVVAADVAESAVDALAVYAQAFGVADRIRPVHIDVDWLGKQPDGAFDGFFSSNVIDVVPLEMAKDIVRETARVVAKGSPVIYSLNFHMDLDMAKQRGLTVKDRSVYMEGVLRLTSLSDEEWQEIFAPYYEVQDLIFYAWPGENVEKRRLFILRRK